MSGTKFSQEQYALLTEYMREEGNTISSIQPIARETMYKGFSLSFAQQRLWFLDQLQSDSPAYNIAVAYRIKGDLNIDALKLSVNEIIRRHEILRTTFQTVDGKPVQRISAEPIQGLIVENLEQVPMEQRESEMQRRVMAQAREPFNLVEGPLLRVRLFQLSEREHVLLFTVHHIVFDGWSLDILSQELSTLYTTYIHEKSSPLPELPVQYVDFAYWQRDRLQGEVLDTELSYWKQQLADAPLMLELPTDRPRPAIQTFHGALYTFMYPKALSQALKGLSRQENCTLFQTLLAAFQVLLHRYTGQQDIIVASPIANREHVEVEKLIGFFANTLALRGDLSGNPTFREVLAKVRETALDAYTHQVLPFEKLVDELQLQRDLSYTPLAQVAFALQSASDAMQLNLIDLELSPLEISNGTTKFDVSLEMVDTEEGLIGRIQYSIDLFDAATIARMANHLQCLLEGIVAAPHSHISELPLVTVLEYQPLIEQTRASFDHGRNQCIHELFENQVKRTPNVTAIVFEEEEWTYQELDERANQLAHFLRQQGVRPEQLVGICMERSLEMIVGLLGILKAGGVCVPLDPMYPQTRLSFMLKDAHVSMLLAQQHILDLLPVLDIPIVCLDSDWKMIAQQPSDALTTTLTAENVAYVIYTSGSTGTPKGVMLRHGSICNRLCWGQQTHPLTTSDRVLQEASFSFDFAIWEFFGPLVAGAQVVLARPEGQRDIDYLIDLIEKKKITVIHLIPSLLRVFLDLPGLERCKSVRHVYGGAEPLPLDLWQRFAQRMNAQFHNVYGPTEATIDSTCWTGEKEQQQERVLIGKPISNAQIYTLDQYGQLTPIGVPGEVYISGAGLARGYLNRPEITAERFVPHPFSNTPGERLYRTGDVARYLADGNLEYVGRVDHQVKVRGFRIELSEIEITLKSHPAVKDAIALVREDEPGEKRLVAYLVLEKEAAPPQITELRHFLQQKLPDYMLPTSFVTLSAFPLSPNGKIDRQRLPAPDSARPEMGKSYVAPRTPTEELLATIWEQVLGIEQIGVHDNYFELGGDSIRSVQIVARAKAAGLQISVQQLFRHQTVASLIEASSQSSGGTEALPCTQPFELISPADREKLPSDVEDAYPLTTLQTGMLYHMDMTADEQGAPDYHNVDSYYYRAPFDPILFQQAITRSVQRHPVLRTSFDLTSYSVPLQLVHKSATLTVQVEDIRQYTQEEQEHIIRKFVAQEQKNHFDMAQAPLLRFHVHHRTDDSFQCTFTEYHPIIDGWSLHTILAEVFNRYFRMLKNEDSGEEEPLTTTFRDFVALEKIALQSEACLHYWEDKLADYSRLKLPQWTRSESTGPRYGKVGVPIPFEVCEGLRGLARQINVPLKSVLFAAHIKVMSILSGQTDILTGQLSHGRLEVIGGERVTGLFLNILPLRLTVTDSSWSDLVRQTFETECGVLPFRRYPLAEIQRRWGGRTPLLNSVFSYLDFHVFNDLFANGQIENGGFKITSHNVGFVLNALFFASVPGRKSGQIFFDLAYETARIDEENARRVGEYYIAVMKAMIADPQGYYKAADVLPVVEANKVLNVWNTTKADYAYKRCIPQLVEEQVERTPNAIAVDFEGERLTYRELNERANQLAHALREWGVGPELPVGICVERSLEMAVGLLAILKAGGICVPLDPEYPYERIAFMLKDARVSILLTQEHLVERLPEHDTRIFCLDVDWNKLAQYSSANPDTTITAENAAYVIYTSGSTGTPKGVMVTHRSISNRICWGQINSPLTAADRVLQEASFSFDFAIWEFFGPLTSGAQVVLPLPGGQRDIDYLVDLIARKELTVIHLIPSLLRVCIEQPDLERCTHVRHVYGGAEPLSFDLWHRFAQRMHARFHNVYGPTEATIDSTCWTSDTECTREMIPIGRPITNAQIYLLDQHLQPAPIGVPGEVYISGAGLARGYLQRPELTAERFIPHPFSNTPGERLYRTGDVACYLPDGTLEYVGRVDHQVKIRGFRIEPGEVEAVLSQHPLVQDVVVLAWDDSTGKQLVAYIVAREEVTESQWRDYLHDRLPEYMIPASFVCLPSLPLTPNGKVDRRALPAPGKSRSHVGYLAPCSALEQQLAQIWEQVLGVPRVGIQDNFFDLGGHSLTATQIISRARRATGVNIPLLSLFEDPTVAGLARAIEHLQECKETVASDTIQASERGAQNLEHLLTYLEDLSETDLQSLLQATSSESSEKQ